ncbi:MAG TPA: hypothetical protein VFB70_14885 [Pyrinomonadaceae bacterium]|jgi:hypothetical protein|nr:hypothetical protein [Pyrinomonadaceae bacterium]
MTLGKILLGVLIVVFLALSCPVNAQDQDDDSKEIKAQVFVNSRPRKKSGSTAKYRRVSRTSTKGMELLAKDSSMAQIGLTIWRFRPTQPTDKTKELLVEEDEKPAEFTLERVEEGISLAPGQRIRLSLESLSRDGYLYVIDREEYADGTLGDPVLVFPNQKSAAANYVRAGRLVYLPSSTGRFRIQPSASAKEHVAEVLTVIVAPKPLINADKLGAKSTRLERNQVEDWLKQWETSVIKFEMNGGAGQAMTPVEQSAAQQNSVLLTQEDPAPQTVFQVAAKPGSPLLITVPLKFAKRN